MNTLSTLVEWKQHTSTRQTKNRGREMPTWAVALRFRHPLLQWRRRETEAGGSRVLLVGVGLSDERRRMRLKEEGAEVGLAHYVLNTKLQQPPTPSLFFLCSIKCLF